MKTNQDDKISAREGGNEDNKVEKERMKSTRRKRQRE